MEEGFVLLLFLIGGSLFFYVLFQRIREYKNDKYKDVEK
jgi:hypothetical protein|tara:strand:- start:11186 stop:11302 length:117 start_codon:yes stop_codon:yes gene_type:complete